MDLKKAGFVVRVDCFPDILGEMEDPEFRIVIGAREETTIVVNLERGRLKEFAIEKNSLCMLNPSKIAAAAYQRTLEVAINRDRIGFTGHEQVHTRRRPVAHRPAH